MDEIQAQIDDLKKRLSNLEELYTVSYKQKIRLDNALKGTKTYYVVPGATGPTGPSTTKLTYKDGILTAEI